MGHAQQDRSLSYEFGPFCLDGGKRLLMRQGEVVPLTPKVFDTLLALVENSGRVIEKVELMKRVWPDSFVEEGNLTLNISLLRKALGEDPSKHHYIVTVPGRGYRFVAAVKELAAEDGEQRPAGSLEISDGTRFPSSCAILPLKSLGPNEDEYLGLGMADALITRLSNIRDFAVRPTSAIRRYASSDYDPAVVGRELGVESVLEGSIRRAGERIRVTVQLVSVRDGAPLWADKFDVNFTDIFAVEDSISEQVTQALSVSLTAGERTLLTKRYTENTQAYEAYLRGRHYLLKWTIGFKNEIEHYHQAIRIDPKFALAYAGLADTYYRTATVFLPPHEAMPKAEEAATKAVELDDSLAEAHASLGLTREYWRWDWSGAEKEFRRALELNPNYATGRLWYGLYLMETGRLDESLEELERAREIDPFSLEINTFLALPLYCAGRFDRAAVQLAKTIEMEPLYLQAYYFLGWVCEKKGEFVEAVGHYRKFLELVPHFPMITAAMGHALGVWGKKDEARKVLGELNELSSQMYVSPYDMAIVYKGLGETEQAFAWLEKAFEERSVWMVRLNVDRRLDDFRSDPRFTDLLRRVGL